MLAALRFNQAAPGPSSKLVTGPRALTRLSRGHTARRLHSQAQCSFHHTAVFPDVCLALWETRGQWPGGPLGCQPSEKKVDVCPHKAYVFRDRISS